MAKPTQVRDPLPFFFLFWGREWRERKGSKACCSHISNVRGSAAFIFDGVRLRRQAFVIRQSPFPTLYSGGRKKRFMAPMQLLPRERDWRCVCSLISKLPVGRNTRNPVRDLSFLTSPFATPFLNGRERPRVWKLMKSPSVFHHNS